MPKSLSNVRSENCDPVGAERWWNGLLNALLSLGQSPGRGSLVAEAALRNRGLRRILYQWRRIAFELDEQRAIVRVLRIYHGSGRGLSKGGGSRKMQVGLTFGFFPW